MNRKLRRLFAFLLTLVLLLGLAPTMAYAADSRFGGRSKLVHVYTEEENAAVEKDVFAKIQTVKNAAAARMGGVEVMTESDYIRFIPQVINAIERSDTYVKGSLQRNGNFLVWQTTKGIPCCYDPRMEAELHNTVNDPTPAEVARAEKEAAALLENYTATRGGSPTAKNIGLIQPYWESSSSYSDSSFTSYSPYYKTMWQNLYGATGGSGVRYSMTNATVDNIAKTMEQCGLVIFDSHGTTDYSGSNEDYTSRANCSYLCLTTNAGVTSADTAAQTGEFGTYYHCLKGSGYAYVSGTCIANHMTTSAPHSLLYMGICLGMATDGMQKGLRAKGVEVVYGYSQSVTFTGEKAYMQAILGYVKDGETFASAVSKAKSSLGNWDSYSSYPNISNAIKNHCAFPITVSSEDTYPGHGNVDAVQTVNSTWTLFGETYTVTATSNNSNYGTVAVNGYTITATPKTGYYAAGYTVTSGTATVVQDGNTFTVTPSSDCTIRINFAAKTKATVNYLANGASAGSASSYVGDSITLPATAPTEGEYTFLGWVENTVAETTTKPTYYKPGASYTVPAASVTLYALYTRSDVDPSGGTVYQLTETPENGGKYVLVSSESVSGSTGYAVGNSIVASNHYLNAVSVTINGETCTATSANLPKVLWEASGSATGGYSFYNQAAGKYMGLDSSEYLYPSATALKWAYTEEGYLDNQTDSEGYYYLSYDATNGRYTTSKQGKEIYLYQAVPASTAYYTTTINVQTHTHTMTHVAAVAATCTAPGSIEYWYCADCGKYFSDANGENEITLESTVLPALGHNWGDWTVTTPATCAADGVETRTCSRCGETEERAIPATGEHTYGEYISNNDGTHKHVCSVCGDTVTENCTYSDVVTAPTATEQGYTTHTCTVCGYSFVDSYTDPLGNDYLVTFSVPNGVTAPAAMTCHEGGSITLPTAEAPEGYTFLGWVTEDVNNVSQLPDLLTGTYAPTASITLKALYSHVESAGGYQLVTAAPADWEGSYVITRGNTADNMVALKGLAGTKKYETATAGGAVALAATGMTLDGNALTGVDNAYVFQITSADGKLVIRNVGTGTYLASRGSYLYSYKTNTAAYCRWALAMNGEAVDATNNSSKTCTHLGFSAKNWFTIDRNADSSICFWKLAESSSTVYTTVIG